MTKPTKDTTSGRVYLDLQNRARREKRTTHTVTTQSIRDQGSYAGVRISMDCRISTASVKLKLDVNFGDPVTPEPLRVELPSQRPNTPAVVVLGYPVETVLAEKASTAIGLGESNTRVRDYVDIYALTGQRALSFEAVRAALQATASHRGVVLTPLSSVVGDLARQRQSTFRAFRGRLGEDGARLPTDFGEIVSAVLRFVDALVTVPAEPVTWVPETRSWVLTQPIG